MCTVFHILFGHCSQFSFFTQGQTVRTVCMNRFCIGQTDKESRPCFVHAVQKAAGRHRVLRRRRQALLPKRKSPPLPPPVYRWKAIFTADMTNRPHTAGRGANVDGTLRMIRRGRMRCGRHTHCGRYAADDAPLAGVSPAGKKPARTARRAVLSRAAAGAGTLSRRPTPLWPLCPPLLAFAAVI